ncbi:MAG: hypothetical protein ACP5MG_06020 [Verrucomicrobiia bacterium]|jgi:hypothetical protein
MMNEQRRFLGLAVIFIVVVWIVSYAGYKISAHHKITAEKVSIYVSSTDLARLSQSERQKAINKLAEMINSLQYEERRKVRLHSDWRRLFDQMTEQEKSEFIEKTVPVGFKQMLESFEKLPEERRKKVINDALKRLKDAQESIAAENKDAQRFAYDNRNQNAPVLSPELEQKIRMIGLKTFYNESSAQTKAELAPILEEIQRLMERGDAFRGMR